jgi:hypothetical protein
MIRRNTWLLLVVLVALVGFSFYLRNSKAQLAAAATPTIGSSQLFTAGEGSPTGIRIEDATGRAVEVARDQTGIWVLKSPTAAPADQGASEAAATQLAALRVLADIQLGPDIVGLDQPSDTLTVVFGPGKTHKLLVGSVTPIQDGYYCQLDGGPIQVVDKAGVDALLGLLTQPPYLATLTPVDSPTPSAEPATPTLETTTTAPASATPVTLSSPAASTTPGAATASAVQANATGTP